VAGCMPVLAITVAAVACASGLLAFAGPRLLAAFVSRVLTLLLDDEALLAEVGRVAALTAANSQEEVAAVLWSPLMRKALQDAIVAMFNRRDFHDAAAVVVEQLSKDQALKDTIRDGVLEALRNEPLKAEVKAVVIEGLHDEDMRNEMLRAAISTVKTGIREAIEDTELKEVITAAIRDALEDPRLSGVLRGALKDALADQELHRATLQGAVSALNPFKKKTADRRHVDSPGASGFMDTGRSSNSQSPAPNTSRPRRHLGDAPLLEDEPPVSPHSPRGRTTGSSAEHLARGPRG